MKINFMNKPARDEDLHTQADWFAQYSMCKDWWTGHGWAPVPAQLLPSLGVIVGSDDDRKGHCAGFLYMDNSSPVAMMEWVVTNPQNTPRESLGSISMMVDFLKIEAKALGYDVIMTGTKVDGLIKLYMKRGFTKTDEGMTHLIHNLHE